MAMYILLFQGGWTFHMVFEREEQLFVRYSTVAAALENGGKVLSVSCGDAGSIRPEWICWHES